MEEIENRLSIEDITTHGFEYYSTLLPGILRLGVICGQMAGREHAEGARMALRDLVEYASRGAAEQSGESYLDYLWRAHAIVQEGAKAVKDDKLKLHGCHEVMCVLEMIIDKQTTAA